MVPFSFHFFVKYEFVRQEEKCYFLLSLLMLEQLSFGYVFSQIQSFTEARFLLLKISSF